MVSGGAKGSVGGHAIAELVSERCGTRWWGRIVAWFMSGVPAYAQSPMDVMQRAVRWLAGESDGEVDVAWHHHGERLVARVPRNDIWVVLKDDMLIREYEWLGADLGRAHDVIVDAGANVGTFTIMAARCARQVIALEPNPGILEMLESNLARNEADNVVVVPAALWSGDEGAQLDVGPVPSNASLVHDHDDGRKIPCATMSLADVLDVYGPIDLLKFDIEGAESEVFKALPDDRLPEIRSMVGELHAGMIDPEPIINKLRDNGFDVHVRLGAVFNPMSGLAALRKNWRRLEGHLRLKLTVAGTLGAGVVTSLTPRVREWAADGELQYIYACQPD